MSALGGVNTTGDPVILRIPLFTREPQLSLLSLESGHRCGPPEPALDGGRGRLGRAAAGAGCALRAANAVGCAAVL